MDKYEGWEVHAYIDKHPYHMTGMDIDTARKVYDAARQALYEEWAAGKNKGFVVLTGIAGDYVASRTAPAMEYAQPSQ